jgi:hypothetical protein
MLERPAHDHGALALGDVAPEVLALGLGVANEVEEVVLQLEGEACVHAKRAKRLHLCVRPPPQMAPMESGEAAE